MLGRRCWTAVLASVICLAGPLGFASARELTDAQKKLLAQRAARVDALRKLAEQIKGLRINSTTFVKDFVAEDDRIETDMRAFLRGAREVGPPRYYEDGACDLDMEVTMEWVETHLKELHTRYYEGDNIKATDFAQMQQINKRSVIRVTGSGAPPSEDMGVLEDEAGGGGEATGARGIPFGWENVLPQGRLMARRAAEVDGMRKLAERINGLQITSSTFVKDFVAEDDRIQTDLMTFLRGVRKGEPRYHPDQICSVECSITLGEAITTLKELHTRYYHGDSIKATDFDQMSQRVDTKVITETGNGVPPPKYIKQASFEVAGPAMPDWPPVLRATGHGAQPEETAGTAQGKLMAARAAEVDAKRKLAEQMDGLFITSDTTVRDFVAQHDVIRTDMQTYLLGAHPVGDPEYDADGTAAVTVEIPLERLWDIISIRMTKVEIRR